MFRYSESDGMWCLYVGHVSAGEGLSVFPPMSPVEITCFGATRYRSLGWATETDLPTFTDVGGLKAFLSVHDVGLVELAVTVDLEGSFSSNDSECLFSFSRRASLIQAVNQLAPPEASPRLLDFLFQHPGAHVACAPDHVLAQRPGPVGRLGL